MKYKILSLLLLCAFPCTLMSQTVEVVLQKVSAALSGRQTSQAVGLFKQAVGINIGKAEMYYWTEVDKNSAESPLLALELATGYQKDRNHDKAYLFYRELLQKDPDNVAYLSKYAETEVCRGKEDDALKTYEKILALDADNLTANIFIGNYYYLKAEQEKKQLEHEYKRISSPTRMQSASYRESLKVVLGTGYAKAKGYLQKVVQLFPSTEAAKTLDKIKLIEKEANK